MGEAQREEALAQVEPDPLDRVELGAVGRQDDEGDAGRHDEVAARMPAGAVEHHDEMRVRRPGGGDMVEEELALAAVITAGSTRVTSSPVAGRIAVRMEAQR